MKIFNILLLLTGTALVSSKAIVENNLPTFSLPSGFYDTELIELEIKSPYPNTTIYYTLDGSIPTENSILYDLPVILKNKSEEENVLSSKIGITPDGDYIPPEKVTKGNVIRAIAILPDGEITPVVSATYFVGLNKKVIYQNVPVISMITDPDNLFDYEKGIYILGKGYDDYLKKNKGIKGPNFMIEGNYSQKGRESERPATIEYFPRESDVVDFAQDMGIRIKGKATRTYYQKSFHITSREEYGKKNIKYEIIPGNMRSDGQGPVNKYKNFNLRNAGNDSNFAKIRDILLQEMIKNDFFETQQNDFSILFIDGEYWGIYDVYEDYNEHYIANNYNIDKDNVIVIKNSSVEAGLDSDLTLFQNAMKFFTTANMTIPENYEKAAMQFDMEGYAWYAAFYAFIDVKDGWFQNGNWAMWRVRDPDDSVPKADGKWRMMTYDTEYSTGLYSGANSYKTNILKQILSTTSNNSAKMTRAFVKNQEFKNMFVNALCDIKNIHFELDKVMASIDEKENTLLPLMKEHINRNGPDYALKDPEQHFKDNVNIVRNWIKGRHSVFIEFIQKSFGFESAVNVTVSSNDFEKGGFVVNNMNEFHQDYSGEYFKENILYLTAKPKEGQTFNSWELKNCELVNNNELTIGIYPSYGCIATATYN